MSRPRTPHEGPRRDLSDRLSGWSRSDPPVLREARWCPVRWIVPVPALAEVLVGEGNLPNGNVDETRADLAWVDVHPVDERTAVTAGQIANEIAPDGPYLDGPETLIAAVGRELDAPVVSGDGDLTHSATKRVIDVEEY